MNREIKFRCWDKESKLMNNEPHLDVQYGNLTSGYDCEIIMQFTGLLDKNGKDIYEGDIIEWSLVLKSDFGKPDKIHKTKYKVIWEQDNIMDIVGFYFKRNDGKYVHFKNFDDIEIIGNIYQNPELLESVQK